MFSKKIIILLFCAGCFIVFPLHSADIHKAAQSGNLELIKTSLVKQPDLLEARSESGGTLLHYAAYGEQTAVMDFLLEKGAKIDAKDKQGNTPLIWSVANGKKDSLVYLLDKGADMNLKDSRGNSVLHIAVARGHKAVVEYLITRKCDINSTNQNGTTPLIFSITQRKPDIMIYLLNHGANPKLKDNNDFSALRISILFGNLEAVEQLLSHGANPSEKYGDDITPLHIACEEDQSDIAELLIKKGANISLKNSFGYSPLHLAAFHGQTKTCQILLSKGMDVNSSTIEKDVPLHGAAWGGFLETAQLLIDKGAAVNNKNKQGFTPLDYAFKAGRSDMVKLLEKKGAVSKQKTDLYGINSSGIGNITTPETHPVTMTILYDNYVSVKGTRSDWGFSCLIKGTEKTILFDTGGKEEVLLHNINTLEVDLDHLDMIVLSHNHWDHTGGLWAILERHPGLPVYVPYSFPYEFIRRVEIQKSPVIPVNKPIQICRNVYLTGEMGTQIKEMSLVCNSLQGLVLVTGCSHPGIVDIVKRATNILGKKPYFVFGGFHLGGKSEEELNTIIESFKRLGVEKCGATHCTGDKAINMFKKAYGKKYLPIGTGKSFVFK
jgi:7,8-dihydropterin-6-yl-methyl-4-(beta-D-ribofuranosyl)aminobenzene 5'-phosphate synthase